MELIGYVHVLKMVRLYSVCSYGFDRYPLFSPGVLRVLMTLLSVVVPEWIDGLNGLIFNCESFFSIASYRVFSTSGFRVFTTFLYVVLNNQCWKLFSIEALDLGYYFLQCFCAFKMSVWCQFGHGFV